MAQILKRSGGVAEEMAGRGLKAVAAFVEDPDSVSITHNSLQLQFQEGQTPSSGFYVHCTYTVHIYIHADNT